MARQQTDVDELFDIKNNFYIGNLQQCINEAQKIKVSTPDLELERDLFMYRAYTAQQKYRIVLSEIKDSSPEDLRSIKLLAEYFAHPEKREKILSDLSLKISQNSGSLSNSFIVVAAIIYFDRDDYEKGLRILHDVDNLECRALCVQAYLKMNRLDIAAKEVKIMQEKEDDATLTQLALAWVNLATGPEKYQEAFYIYQEMIEKYSSTVMLLNGKANCLILQEKYNEADAVLQEALEKDSNNPDTLINTIVLYQHLEKQEEVKNRLLSQLKDSHTEHPFVKDCLQKEIEFDKLSAERYAEFKVQANA